MHTPETHFLQDVAHVLTVLGNGFLTHPHNHVLRDALDAGRLSAAAYYDQLARLVHRLLWLLAAEAQGVLPAPQASPSARQRYLRSYSGARLRRLASTRRPHTAGLYRTLLTSLEHLGSPPVSPALVTRLLATTLDPVLDGACAQADAEAALLHVKICDPACGTGTFLRAAAQRMAGRLAVVRAGQQTPAPEVMRQALYDVIRHCLYGVDIDAPSVEVCRLSLALDALAPEATFFCLDHHIQCGDSLLGATPALLAQGIPDAAFTPIAGDDKTVVAALRKRNQRERLGQMALPFPTAQA